MNEACWALDDWFKKNLMSLSTTKTNYINFTVKNQIVKGREDIDNIISSMDHIKFLGLTIQYDMIWDKHIDEGTKKLSKASYMIRNIKTVAFMKALKCIYHSHFHSIMTYGIIFWGNSSQAEKVFKLQKRVIILIKGCSYRESCREHFKDMKVLPLRSQYIYSLIMFVIKNREKFGTNKDYYKINTRQYMNMHLNQVNLTKYGKGVYHMAVKIHNELPKNLKEIANDINKFKASLKEFFISNGFYTLDEFLRGKEVLSI
jgi:hypothetical protein